MIKAPVDFVKEIEDLVEKLDIEYIDAVVLYCQRKNIEIETAAAIIKNNESIKSKVRSEAEALHILPKTSKLPI